MKKLIAILVLGIALTACQESYKKAVDDYVKQNFNDPESYECVELGQPQEYTIVLYAMEQVRAKGRAEGWSADSIFNKTMEIRPYFESLGSNPDSVLFRFVEHTYRANNAMGAKVLHKEKWYLNDDLTAITRIEPQ